MIVQVKDVWKLSAVRESGFRLSRASLTLLARRRGERGELQQLKERAMDTDVLTASILNAAIEVHKEMGPGLLESVYEVVLAFELEARGHRVQRQQTVQVSYKGLKFDEVFRADLIVDDTVVIEVKATSRHEPVFARQLLTYLRLLDLPVGLLINFGGATLISGVTRLVNRHRPAANSRLRINHEQRKG